MCEGDGKKKTISFEKKLKVIEQAETKVGRNRTEFRSKLFTIVKNNEKTNNNSNGTIQMRWRKRNCLWLDDQRNISLNQSIS